MKPSKPKIILIGNNPSLAYLISRFAEQIGCQITVLKGIPLVEEIWTKKPWLVLFSSMDSLESAQGLVSELAGSEIPVGVCASVGDEVRAHELGADHCLLHPLTYDGFMAALMENGLAGISEAGRDEL